MSLVDLKQSLNFNVMTNSNYTFSKICYQYIFMTLFQTRILSFMTRNHLSSTTVNQNLNQNQDHHREKNYVTNGRLNRD